MSTLDRLRTALADRYRVDRELGAGGMATVYLAHDLRHERDVAIKVLHPDLGAALGADRFLAEIKTTAKLQHPHILPLLDSGAADGLLFYVMPFVRGETLRARLERERQLPVPDALRIAREVAAALDHAHKQGIIHRDIKPENILLQDGSALVADFGIALAVQSAGTQRLTQTGLSLGTPQYMSPEQAMGERAVDARSDVYALAAVTYEMLAGEPPFSGPSTQAVVAKVLTERPTPLRTVRDTISASLDTAILAALAKLPADRPSSAQAFADRLVDSGEPALAQVAGPIARAQVRRWPWIVAVGVVGGAALLVGRLTAPSGVPLRFGEAHHVSWERDLEVTPALSPDGRQVAYASGTLSHVRIMVRSVDEGRPVPLTGDTLAVETDPQWSPDGTRILFLARKGVYSAPSGGGQPTPEVPGVGTVEISSATWAPDGRRMAFSRADSVFIREADGKIRPLAKIEEPFLCRWAPKGEWIACSSGNVLWSAANAVDFGNKAVAGIVLVRASDGVVREVTGSAAQNVSPTWSADGRWLYYLSDVAGASDVYGVPIGDDGKTSGAPLRLTTQLGAHTIDLARNGTRIAWGRYTNRNNMWALPIPPSGVHSSVGSRRITDATEIIENFDVDPTGSFAVYDSDRAGSFDLFKVPVSGGEPIRLTSASTNEFSPKVSPDGKRISFHIARNGNRDLYLIPADGGPEEQVTATPQQEARANWSPSGDAMTFHYLRARRGIGIVRRLADGHWGTPVLRLDRGAAPLWSPDGTSILFRSTATGGSFELMPADSGAPHVLYDGSKGGPIAETAAWGDGNRVYLLASEGVRRWTLLSVDAATGRWERRIEFDPSFHAVFGRLIRVVRETLYFLTESRESDVWVMEVTAK
jgi:Tol biopolymer transport system component